MAGSVVRLGAHSCSPSSLQVCSDSWKRWRVAASLAPFPQNGSGNQLAVYGALWEHPSIKWAAHELKRVSGLRSAMKSFAVGNDKAPVEDLDFVERDNEGEGVDDAQQGNDPDQQKGGLEQWWRKFMASRTIQRAEFTNKLKQYGVAGILSYGLLNTVYYLGAFLFVWFYVAPSPGGLGFVPAAERFLKLIAMVWAGSQVTKVLRGLGALALAPLVDKGLIWFTNHFRFASRGKAFGFLVGIAVLLAIAVFFVITILWA
ncbi:unnamed protein product [Sphagnum jensenii]|uniref:Uncharacterized protein n=1 Tax=Sphagnum jensenii TaxID=128206 RepID=A0ABP0W964_9BRYO